jgi:serine-type D-Ala-D-Ala carboxypeptidase (penicillin-binding protein 5/6)
MDSACARIRPAVLPLALALFLSLPAFAEGFDWSASPLRPPFGPVDALSVILLDASSGGVLYAQNADEVLPPASMIKLIAMDELLSEVDAGRLSLAQDVPLPPASWARNAPPGSSLMFIGPGQRASLDELLAGLAVPSGNDAAMAAALLLEPSLPSYLARVNGRLAAEGYAHTRLVDASGYSEFNATTAREFARFTLGYVARHPYALGRYHSLREFIYPKPENLLPGHRESGVIQYNYNRLLWLMPEADGLKTGTTPEVGFNLAASAARGDRRLIAVVMGVRGEPGISGNDKRASIARDLLEYGFSAFEKVIPELPEPGSVALYGASERSLKLRLDASWAEGLTLPVGLGARLRYELEATRRVWGAVAEGAALGELRLYAGDTLLAQAPLRAASGAAEGNWLRRVVDWLRAQFERLSGQAFPERPDRS